MRQIKYKPIDNNGYLMTDHFIHTGWVLVEIKRFYSS